MRVCATYKQTDATDYLSNVPKLRFLYEFHNFMMNENSKVYTFSCKNTQTKLKIDSPRMRAEVKQLYCFFISQLFIFNNF